MQHKQQAEGEWQKLSFLEQVGNIGSEVERTIKWKEKGNEEYSKMAFFRSLELFDLTLQDNLEYPQRKELARAREIWVDFIYFDNVYKSTSTQWRNYFLQLLFALRNKQSVPSQTSTIQV